MKKLNNIKTFSEYINEAEVPENINLEIVKAFLTDDVKIESSIREGSEVEFDLDGAKDKQPVSTTNDVEYIYAIDYKEKQYELSVTGQEIHTGIVSSEDASYDNKGSLDVEKIVFQDLSINNVCVDGDVVELSPEDIKLVSDKIKKSF
jgi:hypothetical protein